MWRENRKERHGWHEGQDMEVAEVHGAMAGFNPWCGTDSARTAKTSLKMAQKLGRGSLERAYLDNAAFLPLHRPLPTNSRH